MPSTDHQGSSVPVASFRRSILGIRSDQVHSMDTNHDSDDRDSQLESFQKKVSSRFHDLSAVTTDEFLSATWMQKLLDAFLACQEDFRVILCKNRAHLSKTPLDRLVSEFFERSIKALDICNATRDGIGKIRLWLKHLEIVLCALDSQKKMIGEGQFRRARKALMDSALVMLDEKETGSAFSNRNRSFGRHSTSKDHHHHQPGHSRSLSWSVSRSWSAAKQLQSLANNLVSPRGNEIVATNGLAVPVFTMSYVLMFVLWILVAVIPCQDRSLQIHFSIPRQYSWGAALLLLHDRIMDESKKRDRRNSNGLLKEIYQIEKCIAHMTDLLDSIQFPLAEERKEEVETGVQELALVFYASKNGLDPLEQELREVFRKIMSLRTEGLEFLNRGTSAG
ncbi:ROH1, putative [Actinidia rufa]|uniref:ROH1, putative n=1 Tax=Actinidia rufa TaxID=165716 RepID=A0A7J0ESJ2_9ERIC|nr:ROH1, putative [Actinidia rufa]